MSATTTSTSEQRKNQILRQLRVREQKTLAQIASEISMRTGTQVSLKSLTVPISSLVSGSQAVRHCEGAQTPTYSKARG